MHGNEITVFFSFLDYTSEKTTPVSRSPVNRASSSITLKQSHTVSENRPSQATPTMNKRKYSKVTLLNHKKVPRASPTHLSLSVLEIYGSNYRFVLDSIMKMPKKSRLLLKNVIIKLKQDVKSMLIFYYLLGHQGSIFFNLTVL